MNTILTVNQQRADLVYFLSDIVGAIVVVRARKIGKLRDVAILEHEKYRQCHKNKVYEYSYDAAQAAGYLAD